jgi:hypothetical protein
MFPTPNNRQSEIIAVNSSRPVNEFLCPSEISTAWPVQRQYLIPSILLALLPVGSFLGQYALSLRAGTAQVLLHHPTIMVADWLFVPFNFLVVQVIDWRRGKTLYLIVGISVLLNVLTHAFWQYNGLDPGHMITKTGVILPAGWVHLIASILEMVLLVAFVFCRRVGVSGLGVVTALATAYFVTMGICGYVTHDAFTISDVIAFVSGLFFVLIYPHLGRRKPVYR